MENQHFLYFEGEDSVIYVSPTGFNGLNDREIVSFPKYIPNQDGNRHRGNLRYGSLSYPSESMDYVVDELLKKSTFNQQYHTFLYQLTRNQIKRIYFSQKELQTRWNEKNPYMSTIRSLIQKILKKSKLKLNDFGLDASLCVGLENSISDIDLIIYGEQQALECKEVIDTLFDESIITSPQTKSEFFLNRRRKYSPFMNDEEIVLWESRKISGLIDGIKFSILPIDLSMQIDSDYQPTGSFAAIKGTINDSKRVVFRPGRYHLTDTEIMFGPNVDIDYVYTFLPSRMGMFLRNDDRIFATGMIYVENGNKFVVTQFPWDDVYEKKFVVKIDVSNISPLDLKKVL